MGEKIRDLADIKIRGNKYIIELNEAPDTGLCRDIHIQDSTFRLALEEKDFVEIACTILAARKQLNKLKGK